MPDPTVDPLAVLQLLLKAVGEKQWLLAVPLGVVLVIWGLRTFLGKRWTWLQTDQGGAVLSLLGLAATTVYTTAASPGQASLGSVLVTALWALLSQQAFFGLLKKLFPSGADLAKAVAVEAGKAADKPDLLGASKGAIP